MNIVEKYDYPSLKRDDSNKTRLYKTPDGDFPSVTTILDKTKDKTFFIQINTGKESTKSGVFPEDAKKFLNLCKSYGLQNIAGLMCIPPINEDPRNHFKLICNLSNDLGVGRPSIGMSSDYLKAIEFNPQYIRLGTILFGKRK